jgi:hypothetical protein
VTIPFPKRKVTRAIAEAELEFGNPLELLIAAIRSAHCTEVSTDKRVNLTTPFLFAPFSGCGGVGCGRFTPTLKGSSSRAVSSDQSNVTSPVGATRTDAGYYRLVRQTRSFQ